MIENVVINVINILNILNILSILNIFMALWEKKTFIRNWEPKLI